MNNLESKFGNLMTKIQKSKVEVME